MRYLGCLLACCFLTAALAEEEPAATQPTRLSFAKKSAFSDPVKITKRTGWSLDTIKRQIDIEYDPSSESYELYVPAEYKPQTPYGLFVWISAGPKGDVPARLKEALDKHKLIWIGANNSGNPRAILTRMALAFDAVEGMKEKYKIDEQRIYVGGVSGGAKVATILGVAWPDVYRGGFYVVGSDFYRNVPTPKDPGRAYPKGYNAPAGKLMVDSRKINRHVFFTGDGDMNHDPMIAFAKAYKDDRFEHVTLFDVAGVGHQMPSPEYFEKGLAALDEIPAAATAASRPVRPSRSGS
jgi:hypothetical protein